MSALRRIVSPDGQFARLRVAETFMARRSRAMNRLELRTLQLLQLCDFLTLVRNGLVSEGAYFRILQLRLGLL